MKHALFILTAAAAFAAPPVLTELQPRGAQTGRPFVLTLVGRNLGEGAKVTSTMPATFTPMSPEKTGPMMEGRYASYLVEPAESLAPGVYPLRVETPDGISNIQLFTIGAFPELAEDESRPGGLPNSNDGIESAQSLPSGPVTVNGMLRGPERDVYRVNAKAGEKRVFEVEARRIGSAIDPVVRVLDQSGKMLARSEDAPLLGLDARAEVTFPRDGYYYVEVRDARFSSQAANYYRLKTGAYGYVDEIFPLGGQRGQVVTVTAGTRTITADLRNVDKRFRQTTIQLGDGATLPLPFAVGDYPEVTEPVAAALKLPVTVNGRLAKPSESDVYTFEVEPGASFTFRLEARNLGSSKLMGVLTVSDEKGTVLARSGDEPLPEDFFNVNQSRTAGDPSVLVEIPKDVRKVKVAIEDLALRGGPGYGYRLHAERGGPDFRLTMNVPYLNLPAGGSVAIPVSMERFGFLGDVRLRLAKAPKGVTAEGGYIVDVAPVKGSARLPGSRGVLILTAEEGAEIQPSEVIVEGVARLADGTELVRRAQGLGMLVDVAGATQQGSVDRQRPLTAPWLALDLPIAGTGAKPASLQVELVSRRRMEEGDEFKFRWKWRTRDESVRVPPTVGSDLVGALDVRAIDMKVDPADPTTGTFLVTTTKITRPAKYDMYVTGRLGAGGDGEEVISRPISVEVEEVKAVHAENTAGR